MINRVAKHITKQNPKLVPSLVRLNQLALQKIFAKLDYFEEKELELGIDIWTKKIIPRLNENHLLELKKHYTRELNVIINALIDFEDGKYNREKENFKRCGIDYKKAYRGGL